MWFNVIKNAARDRAYQSFIRSFILYDRVSVRPEHIESVKEGDEVKVRWYTPNKAWYWEFSKSKFRTVPEISLRTTITEHEPYTFFVENATQEEYPENWRVFATLYKDNKKTVIEKLYEDVDEPVEMTESPIPLEMFRQIRNIFTEFTDSMITAINGELPNMQGRNRVRRAIREIFNYKPTVRQMRKTYEERIQLRTARNLYFVFELLQSVYVPFIRNVQNNHSHFTWEHIANFYAHFRDGVLREIKGDTVEKVFDSIQDYDLEEAYHLTLRIWEREGDNKRLLMENLPIDRILN